MVSGRQVHDEVGDEKGDYVPKSILVTGGAGFIASHVVIRLVKSFPDYKVTVWRALLKYCASRTSQFCFVCMHVCFIDGCAKV